MRKIVLICFCLISISLFSQDSKYYLKSSVGYVAGKETYKGVATNVGIGYKPLSYLGVELAVDNWYRYANNSASETNTGISMLLHLYPINFKGNTIDFFGGYGFNMNYWRHSSGGIGRHLYPAPLFGVGYYHTFKNFDVGFFYKKQLFIDLRVEQKEQNEQFLISIKKQF